MNKSDLKLDWCSYEAAKYAVEHWHYSQSMPTPPIVKIGVWENNQFIGVVLFSRGVNNNLSKPYGLKNTEICELTRIALDKHSTPVSRIISIAVKLISESQKGLHLIVSFADENQNHHGGIYQAAGWIYSGQTPKSYKYLDNKGNIWHQRQVSKIGIKPQYGTIRIVPKIDECQKLLQLGKHRYLYPLTPVMRAQILPLAKPYPKRGTGEIDNAADSNPQTGGASPTVPLSSVDYA